MNYRKPEPNANVSIMEKTWYLYEDKEGHRWWSDWPSIYMKRYKLITYCERKEKPTKTQFSGACQDVIT